MPLTCYIEKTFSAAHRKVIAQANAIIKDYQQQGFTLTLRQLYYQFVSRDLCPNTQKEYKRLGGIISDARCAGLIDWDAIEDRTRDLRKSPSWESPADIVESCAQQFNLDMWSNQEHRPEVWIEKDALLGVIEGVCRKWDVPYFSCRGYTSQSELWGAGRRLRGWIRADQTPVVFHFGDHDPSGIDMTRDVTDRLALFSESDVSVERLALNMEQVEKYNPPPNPAKITDSRAAKYIEVHGAESWELDALEPRVIATLIEKSIAGVRDEAKWKEMAERRDEARAALKSVSDRWDDVAEFVS